MALSDELGQRLDLGTSLGNLNTGAGDALAQMDGVALPDMSADFEQASDLGSRIDLTAISQSLDAVVSQIPALDGLPAANDIIGPVQQAVALAEQLQALDWPNALHDFEGGLQQQIDSNTDFLANLEQLSAFLQGNPSLDALKNLLQSLAQLTGTNLGADQFKLPEMLPALRAISTLISHLMNLYHQLNEGRQLADFIGNQLDADSIQAGVEQVSTQLIGAQAQPLRQMIEELDVGDAVAVEQAKQAIRNASLPVVALRDAIAQGMGFGEATLAQLNPEQLKQAIQVASVELGRLDLAPFNQLAQNLADTLQPLFAVDFGQAPPDIPDTLDGWLTRLEGKVAGLADGIDHYDVAGLTAPLTDGIATVLALPNEISQSLNTVKLSIKQGLDSIEDAVQAIPVQNIADAIRDVLQPIADALAFISDLVGQIQAALETAVDTLQAALDSAEGAVDTAKAEVENVFQEAKAYIDQLNLDQVIGQVAEKIQQFADLLNQADMSPYFATVVDALETTTDVVDKVPFDMLPDSMEQDVINLVRPVKQFNVDEFSGDIRDLLQIGPDGTFSLRPDLEAALAGIQAKYDELLQIVRDADPEARLGDIDNELDNLRQKIQALTPNVALQPVQDAIDQVKGAIGEFDLNATLAPLNDGFDGLLDKVDEFQPSALLQPLEDQLAGVRSALFADLQLDNWAQQLQDLREQAIGLLDPLDPAQLEPALQALVDELKARADSLSQAELGYLAGSFINSLLGGAGGRADAFRVVLEWLLDTSVTGTERLTGLAGSAAQAIGRAKDAVQQVDPQAIAAQLQPVVNDVHAALAALPDGAVKTELQQAAAALEVEQSIASLALYRQRYLNALTQADAIFTELANLGLSEVDLAVGQLRIAFNPLRFARDFFQQILGLLGIGGLEQGLQQMVNDTFEVATPARLAGIFTPLLTALKGRLGALLDGFIDPLLTAITDLQALEDQLSLADLMQELDDIHAAARQKIELLHPQQLLGEVVDNFNQTQADVLAFDPLGPLNEGLTNLRDSSDRVLGKLSAQEILRTPLAIYNDIMALLEALELGELLTPVLDVLDNLAARVATGLDDTGTAFIGLQDALPDQVGGTSIAESASVGV